MTSVRIATWNCHEGIKDDPEKLQVIKNIDADILVLQECLEDDARKLGCIWKKSNTSRGIGVIFRKEFTLETAPKDTFPDISAVKFSVKKSGSFIFNIVCVWLKQKNGSYDEAMESATPTLLNLVAQRPCLVLGDFNFWVGPYIGIENFKGVQTPCQYAGKNYFFARFVCKLYKMGMVSAQHELKNELWGNEEGKTHRNRNGRLFMDDYIFAPREWIAKDTSKMIKTGYNFTDKLIPSDHLPVVLDIQL